MLDVKVTGVPEHFNFPWHQGIESGAFEEAGVKVRWIEAPGGTGAMMKSVGSGEADIGVVLTQGGVAQILKGNPCRIVKTYVQSPLIWGIHVAADSDIESVEQIQGRKYAISRSGSGSHLMSIVDASERGWPGDSPQFEIVGGLDGARKALSAGTAEVFFWEKFTTAPYVDSGEFRLVGVRETIWPAFVIVARNELLSAESDSVRALLEVLNEQCKLVSESGGSVAKIAARYDLEQEEVARWKALTAWNTDFVCPDDAIQTVIRYIDRLGIADALKATTKDVWHTLA